MKLRSLPSRALACAGLLVFASWSAGADSDGRLVLEAVDVTAAGKKFEPPTPDHPTYYLPLFLGHKDVGGVEQYYIRPPPPKEEIQGQLTAALAKQGYVVAKKDVLPTMVLVFEWGTVAPIIQGGRVLNLHEIRGYVAGASGRDLDRHSAYYPELASHAARHYLMVSAFKYRTAVEEPEVLLWRAHVTTHHWGNYLDEVLATLITHAAPILGKPMKPGGAWTPRIPRVIIGTPEVVPDAEKK
ncbi:MAG TPA: hypothetical protein VM029_00805 [Opitutaceae bacterium]|nr:hypothetical protein [Opitutaceae bacterium]